MLNRIVQFSLRHCGVVIALGAILIVFGAYVTTRVRLDVFPEFAPPQVVIQTEAPGLASEEVEQLVTLPLETGLNAAPRTEDHPLPVDSGIVNSNVGLCRQH